MAGKIKSEVALSPDVIAETLHVSKAYVLDVLQGEMCVGECEVTYQVKKSKTQT